MTRAWIDAELRDLAEQGLERRLRSVTVRGRGRLTFDSQALLNFSSNNYLGLALHPQVIAAAQAAIAEWGTSATSSRLIGGTTALHTALETDLAEFVSQERALVFPTGYMANVGVLTTLAGPNDAIVLDRLCHASLVDAARLSGARLLIYRHADANDAERVLQRAQSFRRRVLVSESLFSMDGDFAPLAELQLLAEKYDALSVLDEAHALGVWGREGRGALMLDPVSKPWDVIVGTLSKSLGSQGGFVAASHRVIDLLVHRARSFIFTTGLAPASAAAARTALQIAKGCDQVRASLHERAGNLRARLQAQGWDTFASASQIVPVRLGTSKAAVDAAAAMENSGIYAPAIRQPTVHAGECRLRFSLTSQHTEEDISLLLAALEQLPRPMRASARVIRIKKSTENMPHV